MSKTQAWLVAAVLLICGANMQAGEPEKKAAKKAEAERFYPRGPEIEKVKTELGLSDDQITSIKTALAAVEKKNTELEANATVKAAEEEVKKAKDALKAAEEKSKAARENYDVLDERKKAIWNNIPDDKKEKAKDLIHYTPPKPPKEKGAKKEEAKKDAK